MVGHNGPSVVYRFSLRNNRLQESPPQYNSAQSNGGWELDSCLPVDSCASQLRSACRMRMLVAGQRSAYMPQQRGTPTRGQGSGVNSSLLFRCDSTQSVLFVGGGSFLRSAKPSHHRRIRPSDHAALYPVRHHCSTIVDASSLHEHGLCPQAEG